MERLNDLVNNNDELKSVVEQKSAASYVELEQVRNAGMDYLRLLSQNKCSQIRRSIKEYEKDGRRKG